MRAQRGFSLAETLIAVTILAMIGGLSFGTLGQALRARERAEVITERHHGVRQALLRMSRELSMAFLSENRFCSDPRSRTIFLAHRAMGGSRVDFTSFSHFKRQRDAKECDQNELSYFVDRDPEHPDRHHLMRREQGRIDERPEEGGAVQVLCENVEDLSFSFYDNKSDQWEDDWDNTAQDTRGRLPKYVKVALTVNDARGSPIRFETKTRIFVTKALLIPGTGQPKCMQ